MMYKSVWAIIGLSVVLLSCHKICNPSKYACSGGSSSIFPDIDSIHVGDTLWLNSVIPINVKYQGNSADSVNYDLSSATNMITDFHLTTPTGINMQNGAIDSFTFGIIRGTLKTNPLIPDAAKTISYEQGSDKYLVSLSIVAQKKGIYFLSFIDIYQAQKKCDKISIVVTMNNSDNHLNYLRDLYYGGEPINLIDSTHTYCFKVY